MMEPWNMGACYLWVVMNSPHSTSSKFKSHSYLNKTWPPWKLWGHPGEIIKQPH